MYPGGSAATSGGGPDFGRPPESPEAAQAKTSLQQAFARNRAQMAQQGSPLNQAVGEPQVQQQAAMQRDRALAMEQQARQQGGGLQARTMMKRQQAKGLAQKAMMAAAKRRMGRGTL